MLNISKICRILLAAAFVCVLLPEQTFAASGMECLDGKTLVNNYEIHNMCCKYNQASGKYTDCVSPVKKETQEDGSVKTTVDKDVAFTYNTNTQNTENTESTTPTTGVAVNTTQSAGAVSGCSGDLGLFSGLITTGKTIFEGMRDLIYVVAGFGIIGVAVGGFFGNLNWKWLGAIIIGLVVIATTGELITAITGCTEFTSTMIQDTLK